MIGQSSITANSSLLAATAERFGKLFGAGGTRTEAVVLTEGAAPSLRHESQKARFEPRTPFELLQSNSREAVERRLRRLGFSDEVIRGAVQRGSTLEARFDVNRVGLERIIGRSELLAIRYLDAGQRAGRAVCRVVIRSSTGRILGYGTGSMISPSLLMTNNHVLESASVAGDSLVEFNFQLGLDGAELPRVTFRLCPDLFFMTSPQNELDCTVVAVSAEPTVTGGSHLQDFGFNALSAERDEILAGESVTIIQHPGGDLKQIALRENNVLRFPNTGEEFLYYETDTTPGSSGAPVFNDQWEVVALHHSGFPERDAQNRILTTDGQIWREGMGDERIHWIANEGIRVVAIRDFLANARNLSSASGALRDGAITPPSLPATRGSGEGNLLQSSPASRQSEPTTAPQPNSGATAVWTIPLTISVGIGVPVTGGAAAPTAQNTPQPTQTALNVTLPPVPPSLSHAEEPTEADFEAAKKAYAEAATRPYFDAAADQAARTSYYSAISSTLSPARLYDALNKLVSQTHRSQLGYKPMVYLYPWVDLQPGAQKIRSIYSDQTFEPLELINRDFEVARLRQERISGFRTTESAANPVLEAAFLESLESQLPFNCEHSVPQSWFQKKQPMKGDLHHLFACESGCNSFRGNTPYFDFSDFREAIRSDCGKSETNKFEPNSGKGAVARATLYFLVRYPGQINANVNEYTADRLKVLLNWHKDFPVGNYERHRNQAIFDLQGNRNPLIDHPEWAEHIDFVRGLG